MISVVIFKLQGGEQSVQLLFFKVDTSLKERFPEVADVDGFLLVELKDVVHVNLLSSTHTGHDIGGNQSSKLQGKVALLFSFSLSVNRLQHVLIKLLDLGIIIGV